MDDFSFEDAGDQLDDDITEAIRVSLAEATASSPDFVTKTQNQGKYLCKNLYFLKVRQSRKQIMMSSILPKKLFWVHIS